VTGVPLAALRGTRIAHLIESDGPGGAERMLASLVRHLQSNGLHNVVILPAKGEGWLAQQLVGSGAIVEQFHLDRPVSPRLARWLTEVLRRHRVALAHSHEFTMAVYGAWAAWRASAHHLITMHGSRYYADRLQRRIAMRAAAAASGQIVAVSQPLAAYLRRDLWIRSDRVAVIANGVSRPVTPATDVRRELRLPDGASLIVAVGNLYPVKGHSYLVEAIGALSRRHPAVHLAIAGRGDLAQSLRAQAAALGVGDRLHLLGLRDDVAAVLAAADVVAMPSLSEGLPLALLEAMFAGRPIVASAVGEIPATLADGDAGVLVPPGDASALSAAIEQLLLDPQRRRQLGASAAARAAAEYSLERMVERYAALYRRLLGNVSPPPGATAPGDAGRLR